MVEGLIGLYGVFFPLLLLKIGREALREVEETLIYNICPLQEGLFWMKGGLEEMVEGWMGFYKIFFPFLLSGTAGKRGWEEMLEGLMGFYRLFLPSLLLRIVREAMHMIIYNLCHSQGGLHVGWRVCWGFIELPSPSSCRE